MQSGKSGKEFVRPSHDVVLGREGGVVLRQADQGDWSDPDDVVQPSNESRRAAQPEESAADHTIHVEEGTAAPSNHSPMIRLIYRVSHPSSVQYCTF